MNPHHPLNPAESGKKGHIPHLLQKGEEPNESKHQASCDKVVWMEVLSSGTVAWHGCPSSRVWTGGQVQLAERAVVHAVVSSSSHHKCTLQHVGSGTPDKEKGPSAQGMGEGLCLCEMIRTWV